MNYKELKTEWKKEENYTFKGWDFNHLNDRCEEEELEWDYSNILKKHLKKTDKLLDIGTGGGEFLLSLNHPYHLTSVTEGYLPNLNLCKEKLEPLGINVEYVADDDVLNYRSNTFDIVINRHESFDLKEVNRVLKSGGYFITQQVGGKNCNDLSKKLLNDFSSLFENHNLKKYVDILKLYGYEIELAKEVFPKIKFYDVGALVYYAKIIKWEFPNFSVEENFSNLCGCQKELDETGFISGLQHRFIIVCKKP